MKEIKIELDGIKETKHFLKNISKYLSLGDVVTFSGNLGAGKTTFIKCLIESIAGEDIEVTSPTFNLLHVYKLDMMEIWHFDLYRLKTLSEVYELGIEDAFVDAVSFIEWPELINSILPKERLEIKIDFSNEDSSKRIVTLKGFSKWKDIIENGLYKDL